MCVFSKRNGWVDWELWVIPGGRQLSEWALLFCGEVFFGEHLSVMRESIRNRGLERTRECWTLGDARVQWLYSHYVLCMQFEYERGGLWEWEGWARLISRNVPGPRLEVRWLRWNANQGGPDHAKDDTGDPFYGGRFVKNLIAHPDGPPQRDSLVESHVGQSAWNSEVEHLHQSASRIRASADFHPERACVRHAIFRGVKYLRTKREVRS